MKLIHRGSLTAEPVSHDRDIMKMVFLRKGDIPNLVYLSQVSIPPGRLTSEHSHADLAEVYVVNSGCGELILDGVSHVINPGSCAAVEPGERHSFVCLGKAPLEMTYFGLICK